MLTQKYLTQGRVRGGERILVDPSPSCLCSFPHRALALAKKESRTQNQAKLGETSKTTNLMTVPSLPTAEDVNKVNADERLDVSLYRSKRKQRNIKTYLEGVGGMS